MDDRAVTHLAVCRRFADAVEAAGGYWDRPTPCSDWDAQGLVEHVIGFHDVLLLRPLDAKPHRPKDDPVERWAVTIDALELAFARPGLFEGAVANIDAAGLVPILSQDVLVHTWDLARAVGADDRLDADLCAAFLARLPADPNALVKSGMFAAPVSMSEDADPQPRLLARLGRDPYWAPPTE